MVTKEKYIMIATVIITLCATSTSVLLSLSNLWCCPFCVNFCGQNVISEPSEARQILRVKQLVSSDLWECGLWDFFHPILSKSSLLFSQCSLKTEFFSRDFSKYKITPFLVTLIFLILYILLDSLIPVMRTLSPLLNADNAFQIDNVRYK